MVDTTDDQPHIPSKELLYCKPRLETLVEEYGNAIEIKQSIDTGAFLYEIRTAVEYWFGGENDHRTSDRIWSNCEAIENGEWTVVGDEFKYTSEVST